MIINLLDKMNPFDKSKSLAAAERAAKQPLLPLTDAQLIELAEYRANWKPYEFPANAFYDEYGFLDLKVKRWTVRGYTEPEVCVCLINVVMEELTPIADSGHFAPNPDSDGMYVQPICIFNDGTEYMYPLGYKDVVEVIGENLSHKVSDAAAKTLRESGQRLSWAILNNDLFSAWYKDAPADKGANSDPVRIGEYIKDNNLKPSEFVWRSAMHYDKKVRDMYSGLWNARVNEVALQKGIDLSDPLLSSKCELMVSRLINEQIEESGLPV